MPIRLLFAGLNNMKVSHSSSAALAAAARIRHLSASAFSDMNINSSSPSAAKHLSSLAFSDMNINCNSNPVRPLLPPKRVLILRHGQAMHNPRAEAAREDGCDFDTFLNLMKEDDQFDASLTQLGVKQAIEAGRQAHIQQALRDVEMVVSVSSSSTAAL